jgi:hypothetical protein
VAQLGRAISPLIASYCRKRANGKNGNSGAAVADCGPGSRAGDADVTDCAAATGAPFARLVAASPKWRYWAGSK